MAKLRKWCAYRTIERPYTRFSKYRKKAFVRSRPGKRVIKFDMGNIKADKASFPVLVSLISKDLTNVRANAIEASRITALKKLEGKLGRLGFVFKILMVPHHAIRENPLAAGAGADRLSTGMKHSFGKIIGTAARIEIGKVLMQVWVHPEGEAVARDAMKSVYKKLPIRCSIQTTFRKVEELTEEQVLKNHLEETKFALQDATAALAVASKDLLKAESDEDKKKAEDDIAAAKAKIESTEKILDVEREHLHDIEEEHSHDNEEK